MTSNVKKRRNLSLVLILCLLLGTFTACGSQPAAESPGDSTGESAPVAPSQEPPSTTAAAYKELTIYTALPESEVPYYFNAFEKDTGIRINYVRLSAGEMLARVGAEGENANAAVMFGGSSENYMLAAEQGLLEAYQPGDLVNVPEEYKDKEGVWVPFYVGALSFTCNSDWFSNNSMEYPRTWDDLLKPEFKGQISMAHPTTSGTSYTILATIVQLMGEEAAWGYLAKLDGNIRQYTKAGAAPPLEAALGEVAIALTFAHDGLKPVEEGYHLEVMFPEDGTGYEVGAMAILKNGPEKEKDNARTFIDWAMSQRGQECFIEAKANRLPINVTARVADGLKPISEVKTIEYDAIWSGENRTRLLEEFTDRVDNASELKED